jgi:hypothetical protein
VEAEAELKVEVYKEKTRGEERRIQRFRFRHRYLFRRFCHSLYCLERISMSDRSLKKWPTAGVAVDDRVAFLTVLVGPQILEEVRRFLYLVAFLAGAGGQRKIVDRQAL